jgi:hypothetical protein
MEAIVADKPRALDAQPPVAHWHLGNAQQRVPIEPHHPLPFAAFDQHLITLHGTNNSSPCTQSTVTRKA